MPIAHTSLSINIKDNDTETRPAHKNHLREIVHGHENSTAASRAIAAHAPARECDCDQLKKTCSVVHHRIFMGFDHDAVLIIIFSNHGHSLYRVVFILLLLSTRVMAHPGRGPGVQINACDWPPVAQTATLTSHCTLHITNCTLHITHCTSHCSQHKPNYTLPITHCTGRTN